MENWILLVKLMISHLLADFFFQPSRWVELKSKKKEKTIYLYIHCIIAGLLAYIIIAEWKHYYIIFFVFITHLIIDIIKLYSKRSIRNFILDQLAHVFTLFILFMILTGETYYEFFDKSLEAKTFWLLIFGMAIVTYPIGIFIELVYKHIGVNINVGGIENAGLWIGIIERILTFILVLFNEYTAIGFIIAAKSFWFGSNLKYQKQERDYILIGNLMSYSLAIFAGLLIRNLMNL